MIEIPVRVQYSRKHKLVSPNGLPVVYVGRPTKWGNPFKIGGRRTIIKENICRLMGEYSTAINDFHNDYDDKMKIIKDYEQEHNIE